MLKNDYLLAKIGADTAENEQHFAENLPKIGNYPTGPEARRGPQERATGRPPGRRATGSARARSRSGPSGTGCAAPRWRT